MSVDRYTLRGVYNRTIKNKSKLIILSLFFSYVTYYGAKFKTKIVLYKPNVRAPFDGQSPHMTEFTGLEQWTVDPRPEGFHQFPHIPADETRLKDPLSMIVCGVTCSQYERSDVVANINDLPSTKEATEVKLDFFFGVTSELIRHLKHCEALLNQMKNMSGACPIHLDPPLAYSSSKAL